MITRHGKPVARMTREKPQTDPAPALAALRRIRGRISAAESSGFDWNEWKQYRDEGRR